MPHALDNPAPARESGNLRSRVLRGGFWLAAGGACNRGLAALRTLVLGRILLPADFGLAAVGQVCVQWMEYFSQSGFNTSLILAPPEFRTLLNTAWTVQMLRGLGLSAALFFSAPLTVQFFHNPDAGPVVRAFALIVLIRGFDSPALVCLRREMDFRRESLWHLSGAVTGLVVAVPLGLMLRNYWALVIAMVAAQGAETVASYWAVPFRPKLRLDFAQIREMSRVGKWIFWNNVVMFPARFLDVLLIGRFLGASVLGSYQMAVYISLLIPDQVAAHCGTLLLPAFANMQGDNQLRSAYLRSVWLLSGLLLPFGAVFSVLGAPFVRIALGPQWQLAGELVPLLVWAGVFGAVSASTTQMLLRLNRPRQVTVASLVRLVLLAIACPIALRTAGVQGVACAVSVATFGGMLWQVLVVCRILGIGGRSIAASAVESAGECRRYWRRFRQLNFQPRTLQRFAPLTSPPASSDGTAL